MNLEERYAVLVSQLMNIEKAVDEGKDPLEGALEAVICTADFVDSDPAVKALRATRSLDRLMRALRDTLVGAKPDLLKKSRGRGQPSGTWDKAVKATIAATVNLLIKWGEGREEAGKIVEKTARKIGLKFEGQAIQAKRVLTWRDEMNALKPGFARNAYDQANDHYARAAPVKARQHDEIEKILKSLKDAES